MPDWKQVHARWLEAHPSWGVNDATVTAEEYAFARAIDAYKRANRRPHPRSSEILAVAHAVGYRLQKPEIRDQESGVREQEPDRVYPPGVAIAHRRTKRRA